MHGTMEGVEFGGVASVEVARRRVNDRTALAPSHKTNGSAASLSNGSKPNGARNHALNSATKVLNGKAKLVGPKTGSKNLVIQDRILVDRCIGGEPSAWSQVYDRFHGSLLASIRAFLGRAGQDAHLVDEISARVWYSLVRNQFELLAKFDPARGCRLSTFLSVLGKSEARLLLRSERRRKTRECVASRPEIEHPDGLGAGALADDDFLATLSPRERAYYLDILVAPGEVADDSSYSRQNQWQLRHRVRKKLEQFLE